MNEGKINKHMNLIITIVIILIQEEKKKDQIKDSFDGLKMLIKDEVYN